MAKLELLEEIIAKEAKIASSVIGEEKTAMASSAFGIKPKLELLETYKAKEAKTASVTDINDGEVDIDDDDDCVILGNNKRKGREDDDDDCVVIDGNTKRGKSVVVDVETLREREDDDDCVIIDRNGAAIDVEILRASKVTTAKEKKLVKAIKKGAAVLDQYLPDNIKANYHVLEHGGEFYDAVLSQANVSDNSNKFYVIQALESDSGRDYMVFSRWGRVGVEGQTNLHGPFTSIGAAIQEFELMFYSKTHNVWSWRKNFVLQPKLYTLLEMDYSLIQSQLEPRLANLMSLICNVKTTKHQRVEIGYNAKNLPLGKLSKSTILKGRDILKSISEAMTANPDMKTLEQLSGGFYTVIPHDFGFKNLGDFIIDTPQKLKSKINMVESLGDIKLATKLLEEGDAEIQERALHTHYNGLQCELKALDAGSKEYSMIEKYMKNTGQGTTADLVHIFRVSRKGEAERFRKYSNVKNRMLLWHGSLLTNWTGILSQGLRAQGRGAYFADMFALSAGFCRSAAAGVLALCEVALGDQNQMARNNQTVCWHSRVVGSIAPDPAESQTLDDGVIVPLGKPKQQQHLYAGGNYSEYIVYSPDQIRMRYLIHVNFNNNNRGY